MTEIISNLSLSVDPTKAVSGVDKVISAYKRLTAISDKSANNINRQFNALNKGFKVFGSTAGKALGSVSKALSNLSTQIALVFGFSELVDAARKIEKFETTFLTFTGTLTIARREIQTLLATTNRFGVSFEAAIIPFAKFAAATQEMSKSDIRNVFTSFIEASSALQLNMQEVNGVFLALQQIASKGRVSMEELRLQLAERIPGTMIIAANAMKMTMMEFEKAARTGAINVNEFLVEFSKGIHEKFGPAAELASDRLFAKMNRLNNAMIFFKNKLFTTGKTGAAYSNILENIANKLNNTKIATGAVSNVLGGLLETIEKIVVSITAEDINGWIDGFSVFAKTVGIATTAVWNLSAALLNIATIGSGGMLLKTLRWPFDLAAAFDLARSGLLDFNDIMAASSYDELHKLVADVMTTDQELQKLRITYGKLEAQLKDLQSQIDLSKRDIRTTALGREIRATQDLILQTGLLVKEKEQLMGLDAMKMDPQLKSMNEQYEKLSKTIENLELKYKGGGPRKTQYATEILQINDQIHALQQLINKRKEYFSVKLDETDKEIEDPTKIEHPPSMQEIERAAKFISRNNKLMQGGLDSLLSSYDRGIKKILDVYKEFSTKMDEFVKKQILTRDEADKYIKEMQDFTSVMYDHAVANKQVSNELTIFNSALQIAKDSLLPEYEVGLKRINDEYDKLKILAVSVAKVEGWDTTELKSKLDEIKNLRELALTSYDKEMSVEELSDIELKNQAYIDLYNNMGIITKETYDILRSMCRKDMEDFILATGNKALAYEIYIQQIKDLDAELLEGKDKPEEEKLSTGSQVTQGMKKGLDTYTENLANVTSQVENVVVKAFNNMEDALVNFCITGKLNFKDFAKSIIKDILRIIVKQIMLKTIMAGIGLLSGGGGAAATGIGTSTGSKAITGGAGKGMSITGSMKGGSKTTYFAKGGVLNSPGLSAFSNQIVNTPTQFAFARGAGLMGEKGPEAIMPLTRLSGGDLGVKTDVGKSSTPAMTVNIHEASGTTAKVEQSEDGQSLEVIIEQVEQSMQGRMDRGTGLAPFMDSRYGRAY